MWSLKLRTALYFEYEEELYAILTNEDDSDEDSDDFEVCVLKVEATDDGEEFVEPDEDKIPELQRIVEEILLEMDECCCGDECDCEHGDIECDCDHHHDDDCGCGRH